MTTTTPAHIHARGWANISPSGTHFALLKWFSLACRIGDYSPRFSDEEEAEFLHASWAMQDKVAHLQTTEEVRDWGQEVVRLSYQYEKDWAPHAQVLYSHWNGTVYLQWEGTFTPNREFWLEVWDIESGGLACRCEWDTGTGEPSRFLDITSFLDVQVQPHLWMCGTF